MTNEAHVSDHAIVRYLERVQGLDVEALRARLLTEQVRLAVLMTTERGGCATALHPEGFRVVVRNGTITTVMRRKGK